MEKGLAFTAPCAQPEEEPTLFVTARPVLDDHRDANRLCAAMILHELGHQRDFATPGYVEANEAASALGHTVLAIFDILLDERLERRLRAEHAAYGHALHRLCSWALLRQPSRLRSALPCNEWLLRLRLGWGPNRVGTSPEVAQGLRLTSEVFHGRSVLEGPAGCAGVTDVERESRCLRRLPSYRQLVDLAIRLEGVLVHGGPASPSEGPSPRLGCILSGRWDEPSARDAWLAGQLPSPALNQAVDAQVQRRQAAERWGSARERRGPPRIPGIDEKCLATNAAAFPQMIFPPPSRQRFSAGNGPEVFPAVTLRLTGALRGLAGSLPQPETGGLRRGQRLERLRPRHLVLDDPRIFRSAAGSEVVPGTVIQVLLSHCQTADGPWLRIIEALLHALAVAGRQAGVLVDLWAHGGMPKIPELRMCHLGRDPGGLPAGLGPGWGVGIARRPVEFLLDRPLATGGCRHLWVLTHCCLSCFPYGVDAALERFRREGGRPGAIVHDGEAPCVWGPCLDLQGCTEPRTAVERLAEWVEGLDR